MTFVGLQYSATASGSVIKWVHCEACGMDFGYVVERTASNSQLSPLGFQNDAAIEQAQRKAEARLGRALLEGIELVPCPGCFRYQPEMIAEARANRLVWVQRLAIVAALAGFLSLVPLINLIFSPGKEGKWAMVANYVLLPVTIFAASGLLFLARAYFNGDYDPNHDPLDERQRVARELAIDRAEYAKRSASHPRGR